MLTNHSTKISSGANVSVQEALARYIKVVPLCLISNEHADSILGSYLGIDIAIKEVLPSTEYDVSPVLLVIAKRLRCTSTLRGNGES
jgi:hypothetical protein